jgi:hypothetical protein
VTNQLFFGDNLRLLRAHIASEIVDLIYLESPFNSNFVDPSSIKRAKREDVSGIQQQLL